LQKFGREGVPEKGDYVFNVVDHRQANYKALTVDAGNNASKFPDFIRR
jgi:hypothetical protein